MKERQKNYFVFERQKDGWVGEKWVGLRTVEVTVELMDVGERERREKANGS